MPAILNDKYELRTTISSGHDIKLKTARLVNDYNQKFLIKIIQTKNQHVTEIQNEVKMLKKLNHRHVVKILEESDGDLQTAQEKITKVSYIVYELTNGMSIQEIVNQGPLSEPIARYYFHQLLEGLQHIHSFDLAHNDIKP